jgi:myo-inositol-1(or 4)-monophosphatase
MKELTCETPGAFDHARGVLESTALRLAGMAGEFLSRAFAERAVVEFKAPQPGRAWNSNPVSGVDRSVEELLRAQLLELFPAHTVIGEEQGVAPFGATPFTWVIDPVDGTSNFINGMPLFGCSIGVLFQGRPVAGAIWCATTHTLAPGVYHASVGGPLRFDGKILARRAPGVWRALVAEPGAAPKYGGIWDTRVLGCATLEFALVAAGVLRCAAIPRPALWDVVAGLVLLQAAGCRAVAWRGSRWETLLDFGGADATQGGPSAAALARWSEPLLIGDEAALGRALGEPDR